MCTSALAAYAFAAFLNCMSDVYSFGCLHRLCHACHNNGFTLGLYTRLLPTQLAPLCVQLGGSCLGVYSLRPELNLIINLSNVH